MQKKLVPEDPITSVYATASLLLLLPLKTSFCFTFGYFPTIGEQDLQGYLRRIFGSKTESV